MRQNGVRIINYRRWVPSNRPFIYLSSESGILQLIGGEKEVNYYRKIVTRFQLKMCITESEKNWESVSKLWTR